MQKLDCLAIGTSVFDVLLTVDHPPVSDERVRASALSSGGGGPAATAAYAMTRLGFKVDLISAVGSDVFGRLIVEELDAQGIGIDGIQVVQGPSTLSAVMIEQSSGRRSMAVCTGCLDRINLDAIQSNQIAAARSVHLDGNNPELAAHAARLARQAGVPVYLDGGNIPATALESLLPLIDVYIPDQQSAECQLGASMDVREACRAFHARGPSLICITQAEKGATAFDGHRFWTAPAYSDVAIVDTTGAGDNFHGAFLFARQRGMDIEETLHFANAFAALCCRGVGGRATVPDLAETMRHVAKAF